MSQYVTKIRTDQGDLPIDYNALANLPTISNPNLLINGDFRNPVNQRGITKYEGQTIKGYTIDRWCMGDQDYQRTVEIVDGGITVTNPNTTYIGTFQQIFEHTLPQGNYTLSVKVKGITSGGGTMSCGGSHSATKKELSVGVNTLTLTNATISSFLIYLAPSSSMTLEWAKLECGTTATPFVPKPYVQEVADCQRYYTKSNGIRLPVVHGTSSLFMTVPLSATLRDTPTVTFSKTNIVVVRDDSAEAYNYTISSHRVNTTNTHIILEIGSTYGVNVYKAGCVAEDFPIFIDAEIY